MCRRELHDRCPGRSRCDRIDVVQSRVVHGADENEISSSNRKFDQSCCATSFDKSAHAPPPRRRSNNEGRQRMRSTLSSARERLLLRCAAGSCNLDPILDNTMFHCPSASDPGCTWAAASAGAFGSPAPSWVKNAPAGSRGLLALISPVPCSATSTCKPSPSSSY